MATSLNISRCWPSLVDQVHITTRLFPSKSDSKWQSVENLTRLAPNKLIFYNCSLWPEIGGGLNTMFTAGVFKQKYISLSFPTFPSVSESAVSRQRLNLPLEYSTSASSADADCSNTALWAFPLLVSPKIVSLTIDVGQKRKQCMLLTYQQTWLGSRL